MSTTMTVRLEDELKDRLTELAKLTNRSKSFLASEAIREFIELNEWQLSEIKNALHEADNEDFAADSEVDKTFAKWTTSEK
jgi:RHH-type rel operon transcriptional repressor/antitoxin RelB